MTPQEVAATRSALLDVAQRLYEAGGDEAMSFRAIASGYGCSNTMPYTYFASKAEIVDGLRIRAYRWLKQELDVAARSKPDPLDALQALATAYVRAGTERPRLYELLYSTRGAMSESAPELIEAKLGALGVCQRVIEAAAEASGLALRSDPKTTAHIFWAAAHGLVSLDSGGFLVVGRSLEQLYPVLFTAMSAGMVDEEAT